MPIKQVDGVVPFAGHRTWWRRFEPADESAKAPLVCLHGGPGLPHDYLEPLKDLAERGRPVIFYDQVGCGNSSAHTDRSMCTIDTFVRELSALRTNLGLERLHLLGHSWGGMLGLEYLLTKPAGVIGFVAASTLASMPRLIGEIARLREALPASCRDRLDAALAAFHRAHVCRLDDLPECIQQSYAKYHVNDFVTRTMLGPNLFQMDGSLRTWDISPRLSEMTVPVLVTCGRYDETTPNLARELADGIAGAELQVFENSSHVAHIEEHEPFLEAVENFLLRSERRFDQ